MSWYSPNMAASSSRPPNGTGSTNAADPPPPPPAQLGTEPPFHTVPATPPNVRNLTPNTCLALSEFKDLLRQHRQVDDSITTRLNRYLAQSRDQGHLSAPSLLSSRSPLSASDAADLGTSTYSHVPDHTCLQVWRELVHLWTGREEVVRYCIGVVQAQQRGAAGMHDATAQDATERQADRRLDADWTPRPRPTPSAKDSEAGREQRWGRGELKDEFLTRQLRNELAVESIIRQRSLDAFKSRCRFFQPSPPVGPEGDRERAMWQGTATPVAAAHARLS